MSGAHYGELPLAALPSGSTGDIFYFSGSNWIITQISGVVSSSVGSGTGTALTVSASGNGVSVDNVDTIIFIGADGTDNTGGSITISGLQGPTGATGATGATGPSGSNTIIVGEQDGSPRVLDVVEIKFSGSTVTDEGGGVVLVATVAGSGSGTDHGALTGLADDDHPQYLLTTEGEQGKVQVHGAMGATETFDPTDGNLHTGTLNANCVFTLNAPPSTRNGSDSYAIIELAITGAGTNTWSWPGSVVWAGGSAPSPPGNTELVRVLLETWDGGTTWYGVAAGGTIDHGSLGGLGDDDHPQYIKDSEFGAKGRILVASGSGVFDDLVVGSNGQVLTADSTQTLGVKWSTPSGSSAAQAAGDLISLFMPLTTVVSGTPQLMWGGDDALIPTELPI